MGSVSAGPEPDRAVALRLARDPRILDRQPLGEGNVQLDRVPLSPRFREESGPQTPAAGVTPEGAPLTAPVALRRHVRAGARALAAIVLGALSLMGQGERYRIDPRFVSPTRAIASFWEALRHDDEAGAAQCMVEGPHDLPYPGMLWFLPPTTELRIGEFHSMPVENGHVLITYVVRYRPVGLPAEQAFVTGCEMIRQRGEWRIVKPMGEVNMPDWKPLPRSVDI